MAKGHRKEPVYVTRNLGIRIISFCNRDSRGRQYCYIYEHPFFSCRKVLWYRILMTDILGRKLERNEHVHHKDGDVTNDDEDNLELISAANHNKHHKTGFKHTFETRVQIGQSVLKANFEGRRQCNNKYTKGMKR